MRACRNSDKHSGKAKVTWSNSRSSSTILVIKKFSRIAKSQEPYMICSTTSTGSWELATGKISKFRKETSKGK